MKESTSNFIQNIFKMKFLSKLKVAQIINYSNNYLYYHNKFICTLPQGDKLSFVHSDYFILVPIEKRNEFFKSIDKLKKKYKISHTISHDNRRIEKDLERFNVNQHSWYDVAHFIINDSYYQSVGLINFQIIRVSESFIILSLHITPQDSYKYDFYNFFNKLYNRKQIIKFPKIKAIFKVWPSTIYTPSSRFERDFNNIINRQNNEIYHFLKKNNLIWHSGYNNYISSLFTFSYQKDVLKFNSCEFESRRAKIINEFWECFGFKNYFHELFSDAENQFHFHDTRKFNAKLLLVDETLTTYNDSFVNYENYLTLTTREWLTCLAPIYVIDNYFDFLYTKIDFIRNKFFTLVNQKKKGIKKLMQVITQIDLFFYDFDRIQEEYFNEERFKYNKKYMPEFIFNNKYYNKLYYDSIYQNLKLKKNKLEQLFKYSLQSIDRYKALSFNFNNIKVQYSIYFLTCITILIGLIQIIGIKDIINACKDLIKYYLTTTI